jgi:hypothetical protein
VQGGGSKWCIVEGKERNEYIKIAPVANSSQRRGQLKSISPGTTLYAVFWCGIYLILPPSQTLCGTRNIWVVFPKVNGTVPEFKSLRNRGTVLVIKSACLSRTHTHTHTIVNSQHVFISHHFKLSPQEADMKVLYSFETYIHVYILLAHPRTTLVAVPKIP